MTTEETATERTMRIARQEWQQEIVNEFRKAILSELGHAPDQRDAMLRQLKDIAHRHGLGA